MLVTVLYLPQLLGKMPKPERHRKTKLTVQLVRKQRMSDSDWAVLTSSYVDSGGDENITAATLR